MSGFGVRNIVSGKSPLCLHFAKCRGFIFAISTNKNVRGCKYRKDSCATASSLCTDDYDIFDKNVREKMVLKMRKYATFV